MFDGPFDLLLHLILKDEVDLYEVSLAVESAFLSGLLEGGQSSEDMKDPIYLAKPLRSRRRLWRGASAREAAERVVGAAAIGLVA